MATADKAPIIFGNSSDKGMVREENQDYFAFIRVRNGLLFIVADGMGGETSGQLASRIAVQSLIEYVTSSQDADFTQSLIHGMKYSNSKILDYTEKDPSTKGMGTTLDAVFILDGLVYWAHVGDSRIYLYRDNNLQRLSADHTLVARMVADGLITEDEAKIHPNRHILSQAIGRDTELSPESGQPVEFALNDTYLMCTDGLTDLVSDQEIVDHLKKFDPQTAAEALVALAKERGGHDNITLQIIRKGLPKVKLSKKTTVITNTDSGRISALVARPAWMVSAFLVSLLLGAIIALLAAPLTIPQPTGPSARGLRSSNPAINPNPGQQPGSKPAIQDYGSLPQPTKPLKSPAVPSQPERSDSKTQEGK